MCRDCCRLGGPYNALHDRADDFYNQFPGFYIDEEQLVSNLQLVRSASTDSTPCKRSFSV